MDAGWSFARIQRGHSRHGQERHDEAEQTHQVVVIEVGRLVNQLHVGEQQEEGNDGLPVAVPQHYTKAGQRKEGKMDVHPPSRPRLHPREPGVAQVIGGLDIHL